MWDIQHPQGLGYPKLSNMHNLAFSPLGIGFFIFASCVLCCSILNCFKYIWVESVLGGSVTIFNSFAQDIAEAKEFLKQRGVDVGYDWRLSLLKNQGDFQTVSNLYDHNLRYKLEISCVGVLNSMRKSLLTFGLVSESIDAEYVGWTYVKIILTCIPLWLTWLTWIW